MGKFVEVVDTLNETYPAAFSVFPSPLIPALVSSLKSLDYVLFYVIELAG